MDNQVRAAQVWLNSEYSGVIGYTTIVEDGVTGWATMFAATRALQHELGIVQLSDTFGAGTLSALTAQIGTVSGATLNTNVVRILQCALWCKGYWGGNLGGVYDSALEASIATVVSNMGLPAGYGVKPKIFKSLLSMDAYVKISFGFAEIQEVQRWMNATYLNRRDFYVVPCDGVFSRDVQKGLMYAIQYELGLADGVANGNFGPSTIAGLKGLAILAMNSASNTVRWVRIFQACLRFNRYMSPFTGTFDLATAQQTLYFQEFTALPETAQAGFSTWASLLVSTGDPDREVSACDTNVPLTSAKASLLANSGFSKVGRYLSVPGKRLMPGELAIIDEAGLEVFVIFQEYNNASTYFSEAIGRRQGAAAYLRARQLGFRDGTVIFFVVDYDAGDSDISTRVLPFFRGVASSMQAPYTGFRVGVYGPRNVCSRVVAAELAEVSFVGGISRGWSGNLGYPLPASWVYDQIQEATIGVGSDAFNIDRVVSTAVAPSVRVSDMLATPLAYEGNELAFDAFWFWLVEQRIFAERACEGLPSNSYGSMDSLVFGRMHERLYSNLMWQMYTVPSPPGALMVSAMITFAESPFVLPPETSYAGDLEHFAATLRGYMAWGAPEDEPTVQIGDLGGWALDLVSAWSVYAGLRSADPTMAGTVYTWIVENVGSLDVSMFGPRDLVSDVDGYLAYAERGPTHDCTDALRRILISCGAGGDAGWRFRRFAELRFGSSKATCESAVLHLFGTGTLQNWTQYPVGLFLTGRRPGEFLQPGDPAGVELDTELAEVARAFADMLWSKF